MAQKFILLVEDNRDEIELTRRVFRKSHIDDQLVVMRDGKAALDFLFSTPHLPEVVLLDLSLPKVGGLAVLEQIRCHDKTRSLPVIILTSSPENEDLQRCYKFGIYSYIRKPFDLNLFTQVIEVLALRWLGLENAEVG